MPSRPSTELSAVARSLRALEILQTRPGITASELGERLGVSDRAARRHVALLREAGIPVEATRGPHGGYRLGRGTRLPPVSFTQDEALGLVMGVLSGAPEASGGDDLVGTALAKVLRALPEPIARAASALAANAAAAPDRRAAERPGPTVLSALVAATAADERVVIGYRGESGRQWSGLVDPWALVVRHGRWYLLCHSHGAQAVRTYRVDRVSSVDPTGAPCSPPAGLDPVAELERHLGAGWEFDARVAFDAPLEQVARWVRPTMGVLEPAPGGGCVLVGSTSNPDMYAQEWLSTVALPFRVEGGPQLRDAVAALAERLAAAVADPRKDAVVAP